MASAEGLLLFFQASLQDHIEHIQAFIDQVTGSTETKRIAEVAKGNYADGLEKIKHYIARLQGDEYTPAQLQRALQHVVFSGMDARACPESEFVQNDAFKRMSAGERNTPQGLTEFSFDGYDEAVRVLQQLDRIVATGAAYVDQVNGQSAQELELEQD